MPQNFVIFNSILPIESLYNGAERVYTMPVDWLYDEEKFKAAYAAVSPSRRLKVDRMKFQKGKCLSLGAELLLGHACKEFGVEYGAQTVCENEYGKPQFQNSPWHFNLSHSGKRVLCVMGSRPLGCDVQRMGKWDGEIAKRFFHPKENRLIDACQNEEQKQRIFYRLWTLKESFMKCCGLGFHLPLKDFAITFDNGKILLQQDRVAGEYEFFEKSIGEYQYAWCVFVNFKH